MLHLLDRLLAALARLLVAFYRLFLSPLKTFFFGPAAACRFYPTCSQYCAECLRLHPVPKALYLSARRLLKCHPFHPGGPDPVPPAKTSPS